MTMQTLTTHISEVATGDTLLVSSKSWLARQIQAFQKMEYPQGGKWNHAGMFWWAYDECMVIEADKYGIAITPFADYLTSNKDLLQLVPVFKVDGSEYGKYMLPYCGHTRYNRFNLVIAQAIKFATHGRVWIGPNDSEFRFICAHFNAHVYNHFEHCFERPGEIAPVDLWRSDMFTHKRIDKTSVLQSLYKL